MKRVLVGTLAAAASGAAMAGPTPLGTTVGVGLGTLLGGVTAGSVLPIAGSGLLLVAASSLAIGIRIARKKKRKS